MDLQREIATVLGDQRQEKTIVTRRFANEVLCKGVRVLLVDDSIANVELMKEFFKVLGCEVDCAYNGKQAIELVRTGKIYDICFMDVHMQDMDGLTATGIIKSEINANLPIIALTAAVMKEGRDAALASGMNDFLGKSVQLDALREKIREYVLRIK